MSAGAVPVGVPPDVPVPRPRPSLRARRPRRVRPRRRVGRHPTSSSCTSWARSARRGCSGCRSARGSRTPSRPPVGRRVRPTSRGSTSPACVVDGEQVRVPAPGDPDPPVGPVHGWCDHRAGRGPAAARRHPDRCPSTPPTSPGSTRCPGVGPVLAQRIVDWRDAARPVHQRRGAGRGQRHRREAPRPAQPAGDAVSAAPVSASATVVGGRRPGRLPPPTPATGRHPRRAVDPAERHHRRPTDLRLLAPAVVAWAVSAAALGLTPRGHVVVAAVAAVFGVLVVAARPRLEEQRRARRPPVAGHAAGG